MSYQHREYRTDGTYWVSEFRDDTTRTVTTYSETGAVTSTRPYTGAENAAADGAAAAALEAATAQQLQLDTTADLTKLRDAIDQLATLLGDNTVAGSIRNWRGAVTNQYSATQQRALADLLISDAQANRRVARQVLRLAKAMVGDYGSADVGAE